jgi:hypothetical protein
MAEVSQDFSSWLAEISHGNAQTFVMAEGKRYNFNCDRSNHYVYEIDGGRREGKTGRKKRVYKGVMATAKSLCHDQAERWETVTHPANCPDCAVRGGVERPAGAVARPDAVMAKPAPNVDP